MNTVNVHPGSKSVIYRRQTTAYDALIIDDEYGNHVAIFLDDAVLADILAALNNPIGADVAPTRQKGGSMD